LSALGAAGALLAGGAFAQQDQAAGEGDVVGLGGQGSVEAEQASLAEMKGTADRTIARIDSVEDQLAIMLDGAKEERSVVRVLCLTDKSNQVALALGTAKDRQASMLAALARSASGRAKHEYRLLIVVGDRVELLSAEANQCLGGEAGMVGESSLTVDIDPSLPAPDPGVLPVVPVVLVVPLPASATD
jgi:hypothetical protein